MKRQVLTPASAAQGPAATNFGNPLYVRSHESGCEPIFRYDTLCRFAAGGGIFERWLFLLITERMNHAWRRSVLTNA
jgi:hypothetical protein